MSYQVIARKWRPQVFSDLVGQGHITQTLINALRNGRLHHTLLFTGPRGTGKTSSARILAKALRCTNAVDFVPCGECPSCQEIAQNFSPDVREIDAASNNGVDAIRELRETVGYMPSSGKYKVYIIDEVHMLSTSAFNALLKTLEEPPDNVIFIMATTEVHKIPQTILSRSQRFDFRRIPTRQITDRLKLICEQEKVEATDDALWVIARQGDGSMRDSQSLLDQVITFANGSLQREKVVEILGLTDRTLLFDALTALTSRDQAMTLKLLERLSTSGFEAPLFAQDLLENLRHLLLVKISEEKISQLLELPDSEIEALRGMAAQMSESDIHMLFDMALKAAQDVQRAQDPRLVFEVSMLRMASAPRIKDLQSLFKNSQTTDLPSEDQKKNSLIQRSSKLSFIESDEKQTNTIAASELSQDSEPLPPAIVEPPMSRFVEAETPEEKWLLFIEKIRATEPIFAAKVENIVFTKEEAQKLTFGIPPKLVFLRDQMKDPQIQKKLQGFIDSFWGDGYSFEVIAGRETPQGESAQSMIQKKQQKSEDDIRNKIACHPKVIAAQNILGGQIQSIIEWTDESASKMIK